MQGLESRFGCGFEGSRKRGRGLGNQNEKQANEYGGFRWWKLLACLG